MSSNFLLYGATGYTGALIARFSVQQGLRPILAGRNSNKLKREATELGLEFRSFSLENASAIQAALTDISVVLNCAGPFSHTAKALVASCLCTKTHYLDITGEPAVLEAIAAQNETAKATGITLLPAVGFDVVPLDCLAAHLKARLPSATRLTLGMDSLLNRLSRGTLNTMVESLQGFVRHNGVLTSVPIAWKTRWIDFGQGPVLAVTVPLGDVVTAFYSTEIPNIEVYAAVSQWMYRGMRTSRYIAWWLGLPAMQRFQKWLTQTQSPGPTDAKRLQARTHL